ncbi:MAG: hypothetical protein DRI72_05280 [Bacteroidetes bacterium]|nr:MAG: hypothetical protein DRI72_05280 [Bacteroidota bacterium]
MKMTCKKLYKHAVFLLTAAILFFSSCQKDPEPAPPVGEFENAVFVVNEGNFTAGNASLTYYNYNTGEVSQQVFYRINGAPLGDVANSITFDENSIYVVVNNSHVVYKIDAVTGKYQAKTTGLTSPRHLLKIDNQRALISDLYEKNLTLINTENMEIISRVPLGRTSENLLNYGNKVFVTNWSAFQQDKLNNMVVVIDTNNIQMVDSIQVGIEPNSMVLDKDNYLWVLCSGGFLNEELPSLWKIDPDNKNVLLHMEFPDINSSPNSLDINKTGDTLYYLNKNIYRMAVSTDQLPDNYFIRAGGNDSFYTLGVSPESHIYVTDANDYTRNGVVNRYNPNGVLVQKFETGIVPGDIGFMY